MRREGERIGEKDRKEARRTGRSGAQLKGGKRN